MLYTGVTLSVGLKICFRERKKERWVDIEESETDRERIGKKITKGGKKGTMVKRGNWREATYTHAVCKCGS